MKPSASRLFGHAIRAAGVGAALLFSVSAGHAQSSPFAGFSGVWSGNGKVSLSDGSSERIRCRATYAVDGSGVYSYKPDGSLNWNASLPNAITVAWSAVVLMYLLKAPIRKGPAMLWELPVATRR